MTHHLRLRPLAAVALLVSHGLAQAQNVGAVQTPTVFAVYALEANSPQQTGRPPGSYDPVAELFQIPALDMRTWTPGQTDVVAMSIALQKDREAVDGVRAHYDPYVRGAEFVGRLADGTTIAGAFMSPPLAVAAGAVAVASNLNKERRIRQFDEAMQKATAEYNKRVDEVARTIIGRANFERQGGETSEIAAARYAAEVKNSSWFKQMDAESQKAVETQLANRIDELKKQNAKVSKNELSQLRQNLQTAGDTIQKIQADVSAIEKNLQVQLSRAERASQVSLRSLTEIEQRIAARSDKVHADVRTIQYMTWTQLPPARKLEMLQDKSFMPDMKDRDKTEQDLKYLVTGTQIIQYSTAVGDVAGILGDLGVPINVAEINRGVGMVEAGVTSYISIATGDYFSAVSSVGRLIGGFRNKPDAAAQRHMAIMKQLQTVIDLQIKTLKKLDELSQQIERSTEQILHDININVQVSSLAVRLIEHQAYAQKLNNCRTFYTQARGASRLTIDGLFTTYDARLAHFNASQKDFLDCESLFHDVARPTVLTDTFDSHLPVPLWGYRLADDPSRSQPESPWQYQTNWYAPMLALHRTAFRQDLQSASCAYRLVGQLAATPRNLKEAYGLLTPCPDVQQQQTGLYMRGLDAFASFNGTFSHVANPALVSDIGRLMLFATPFKELAKPNNAGTLTLPSRVDVSKHQVSDGDRLELVQRYGAMSNIMDITLAQQTVLSGPLVVRYAIDALRAANYGFDRKESVEMSNKWRAALAAAALANPPVFSTYAPGAVGGILLTPFPQELDQSLAVSAQLAKNVQEHRAAYEKSYLNELKANAKEGYCPAATQLASPSAAHRAAVIICLMDWHPQFAYNVGLALFTEAVRNGGYDLELVQQWLRKDSRVLISQALPGLPLVRTSAAGGAANWGLRLLHPDGREIFLPVPSAAQIEEGSLAYTPTSYPLQQLRELLLDRAMALQAAVRLPPSSEQGVDAQLVRAAWARTSNQLRTPEFQ